MLKKKNQYQQGDIVFVLYPFSDLSSAKKRPALIVSNLNHGGRYILSQITSSKTLYNGSLFLFDEDIIGSLKVKSQVRTDILFTAQESIITKKVCSITHSALKKVTQQIVGLIQAK